MLTENCWDVVIPAVVNHDFVTGIVRLPLDVDPDHSTVLLNLTETDTLLPLPFVNVATWLLPVDTDELDRLIVTGVRLKSPLELLGT